MTSAYPSEASVVFTDLQQLTQPDMSDLAALPAATQDNVVAAFLAGGLAYTGLAVSVNGDAKGVTVGKGIVYNLGGGYPVRSPVNVDLSELVNAIPDTVQSQYVLIVANVGTASVTETRTLEDASQKPSNPADLWPTVQGIVTTRSVRSATPDFVPGAIAVTPQPPAYNPLLCLIGTALINKTGVVSFTQSTAGQITRLDQLAPIVASLSTQLASAQTALNGLSSGYASLSATVAGLQQNLSAQIAALQQELTALESRQITSTTSAILNVTDYYSDGSGLTAGSGYTISSGVTFPSAVSSPTTFFPLAEYASNLKVLGGRYLTLPYDDSTLITPKSMGITFTDTGPGFFAMGAQGTLALTPMQEGFAVARTRYGAAYGAQPSAQLLASASPSALFAFNLADLPYPSTLAPWTSYQPELSHQNGYWHDLSARGFWAPRTALSSLNNYLVLDTVITQSADDMVTSMTFAVNIFTSFGLLVCEDINGVPDFTKVVMSAAGVGIDPSPAVDGYRGVRCTFPYPLLRRAGQRLHYVKFIQDGGVLIYTQTGAQTAGQPPVTTLLRTSNGWQQDSNQSVVRFAFTKATFTAAAPIELNGLFLGGGIDTVDLLTPAIVPPGCDVLYGTIPQGSTAYTRFGPIDPNNPASNLLSGRPSQLRLFLELTTTGATAPIIDLQASASGSVGVSSARTAGTLTAQSPVRTPSAPVTKINRQVFLSGFNPALHTYTELLDTGTGYATKAVPNVSGTPQPQADGTTLITFSWTLGGAVPSFMFDYDGTTSDTTQPFRMVKSITTAAP